MGGRVTAGPLVFDWPEPRPLTMREAAALLDALDRLGPDPEPAAFAVALLRACPTRSLDDAAAAVLAYAAPWVAA